MNTLQERVCPVCLAYMYADKLIGWIRCGCCGFMKKELNSMISMQELLMGRIKFEDLEPQLQANASDLIVKLNKFRAEYGIAMIVSSGYRAPTDNTKAGGAKASAHMTCQACDFVDIDGKIFEFIKNDPAVLERCELYMEDAQFSPNWIHLQSRPTASGNRIFLPYSDGRASLAPNRKI